MNPLESPIADLDDRPLTGLSAPDAADDFVGLARQVRDRIRGWARRLTGDQDEAEDIAQDVLLRLHARLHSVADQRRLVGWLYRVTHNVAHDRRALMRRRAELLARFTDSAEVAVQDEPEALSTEGLARLVADCRHDLSRRQREIFTMVDLEGRTVADAAEVLGIAESTVRVHLARARQTIRVRMLAEHPALLEEYLP